MRCEQCGGVCVYSCGWIVCSACGLVQGEYMVYDSPYLQDVRPQRIRRTPRTVELSRKINMFSGDGRNNFPSDVYRAIKKYCFELGLPSAAMKDAMRLYLSMGRRHPKKELIIASLYFASIIHKIPRPLGQICYVVGEKGDDRRLKNSLIKRVSRIIRRMRAQGVVGKLDTLSPEQLVWQIVNIAGLPGDVAESAIDFLKNNRRPDMSPHRPEILACATVYVLAEKRGIKPDLSGVCNAYNISQVSVAKVSEKISRIMGEEQNAAVR